MSDQEDQKLFPSSPPTPQLGECDRQTDVEAAKEEAAGELGECVRRRQVGPEFGGRLQHLSNSARYTKPRMSLLGRPLSIKNTRQDARYRRLQARVYNFLERPKTWQSITYHVIVFASVFICLVFSVLSTMNNVEHLDKKRRIVSEADSMAFKYSEICSEILFYMETCMLFWFFTEYCLRMWSAGCRSRYQTWKGRLLFARRPFCIVDLIVITASVIVLALGSDRQMFAASALRGLRFFQILRMIRMDRRGGSWKLLASVVWAHRQELFTTVYIGFLGLIFSSFVMYLIEKDERGSKIRNYADALWWGVITLCTVGYGDITPTTWSGKIVASFCSIAGISFFALPAGILGSGFALKVQQHQRQKHLIRRRVPAATLIQSLWRCYAADPSSTSIATWKPHMRPMRSPSSKFGRLSTMKRTKSEKATHTGNYTQNRRNAMPDLDPSNPEAAKSHVSLAMTESAQSGSNLVQQPSLSSISPKEDAADDETPMKLTEAHKNAIRILRKIKYFVARKKFREALRPYDVKDVIEQYSAGHVDMLARIKVLQFRLDQILGRQGSKEKDVYDSKVSLASRIVKVERSVEDIEQKLELLIDMYKEDRRVIFSNSQQAISSSHDAAGGSAGGGDLVRREPGRAPLSSGDSVESERSERQSPYPRSLPHSFKGLRSILQDKREPRGQTSRRLTRNFSDLGPRVPKRVTYRYLAQKAGGNEPEVEVAPPATEAQMPESRLGTTAQVHAEPEAPHPLLHAPSPPPPPIKSLIDLDEDDDNDEEDEDSEIFFKPPLKSSLKRIRSAQHEQQQQHRLSFTNRAMDESSTSEDETTAQESLRLLGDFSADAESAAAIPLTSRAPEAEAEVGQRHLMRPEIRNPKKKSMC